MFGFMSSLIGREVRAAQDIILPGARKAKVKQGWLGMVEEEFVEDGVFYYKVRFEHVGLVDVAASSGWLKLPG